MYFTVRLASSSTLLGKGTESSHTSFEHRAERLLKSHRLCIQERGIRGVGIDESYPFTVLHDSRSVPIYTFIADVGSD